MTIQFIQNGLFMEGVKDKEAFMPSIGWLQPDKQQALINCENFDELTELVRHVPVQKDMFECVSDPNVMLKNFEQGDIKVTLEDLIFDEQIKM